MIGRGANPTMVMGSTLLDDFPKLRVGFLEAGIEWTTRLVKGLGDKKRAKIQRWLAEWAFVACARPDFPLGDAFRQDQLALGLKKRGDLTDSTFDKIPTANPLRLYHI